LLRIAKRTRVSSSSSVILNVLRQVWVSSTVKDLVAGSGLRFTDRGAHRLKGFRGEWRLFAIER